MVDMENGAGLDYSDAPSDPNANPPYKGGDMWGTTYPGVPYDLFHPNDKGNTKMAVKFYDKLIKELAEPIVGMKTIEKGGDEKKLLLMTLSKDRSFSLTLAK